MAITRGVTTSARTGTTALTTGVTYAAGLSVNELYLWHVQSKYTPSLPAFDGTITQIAQVTGGAGAAGTDSGPVTMTVGHRIIQNTSESSTVHPVTLTGGNVLMARAGRHSIPAGASWDIATATAEVNTAGTAWVVDAASALSLQPGDLLYAYIAINRQVGTTAFSTRALSAAGITFDSTAVDQANNVALGDGLYGFSVFGTVTAGSATVAPRFTGTAAVSCSGSVVFVRLREGATPAPTVTTHPNNSTVTSGATATFSAAFSGSPTSFQWQRSTDAGSTWADISGAVATSYTTPATSVSGGTANNGDRYRCVASNSGGSVTTNAATLTVNAGGDTTAPTLTGSLAVSAITQTGFVVDGPAATDNVAVAGYEFSTDGGATWGPAGWPAPSYTFTGMAAGTTYALRMRAYDAAGNRSAALSGSVTTLAPGGTITSTQLVNNTGTSLAGATVEAYVSNPTTGALVVKRTGITVSAGGFASFLDAALVAGTAYRVVWRIPATGAEGLETLVAA